MTYKSHERASWNLVARLIRATTRMLIAMRRVGHGGNLLNTFGSHQLSKAFPPTSAPLFTDEDGVLASLLWFRPVKLYIELPIRLNKESGGSKHECYRKGEDVYLLHTRTSTLPLQLLFSCLRLLKVLLYFNVKMMACARTIWWQSRDSIH